MQQTRSNVEVYVDSWSMGSMVPSTFLRRNVRPYVTVGTNQTGMFGGGGNFKRSRRLRTWGSQGRHSFNQLFDFYIPLEGNTAPTLHFNLFKPRVLRPAVLLGTGILPLNDLQGLPMSTNGSMALDRYIPLFASEALMSSANRGNRRGSSAGGYGSNWSGGGVGAQGAGMQQQGMYGQQQSGPQVPLGVLHVLVRRALPPSPILFEPIGSGGSMMGAGAMGAGAGMAAGGLAGQQYGNMGGTPVAQPQLAGVGGAGYGVPQGAATPGGLAAGGLAGQQQYGNVGGMQVGQPIGGGGGYGGGGNLPQGATTTAAGLQPSLAQQQTPIVQQPLQQQPLLQQQQPLLQQQQQPLQQQPLLQQQQPLQQQPLLQQQQAPGVSAVEPIGALGGGGGAIQSASSASGGAPGGQWLSGQPQQNVSGVGGVGYGKQQMLSSQGASSSFVGMPPQQVQQQQPYNVY